MTAVNQSTVRKSVVIIVAHPDDETLWAGGTMLYHPQWDFFVASLCRGGDIDRAPKFFKALQILGADGIIGDLDDGPEQMPLPEKTVEQAILTLLPARHFDLIITHHPRGEYTRHLRHEEISQAVIKMWQARKIGTDELWVFAYEDGGKAYYPVAVREATYHHEFDKTIWLQKHAIITNTYGFREESWEARTTPVSESFWCFNCPDDAYQLLNNKRL